MSRSQKYDYLLKENEYDEDYENELNELEEEEENQDKEEKKKTSPAKPTTQPTTTKEEPQPAQPKENTISIKSKIKKVRKRVKATHDQAENALLMNNGDVLQAISYLLKNNKEDNKVKDAKEQKDKSDKKEEKKEAKVQAIAKEVLNAALPTSTSTIDTSQSALNVVVIGHVDSGKSTLMGHLLLLLGEIDEHTIDKYKTEAKSIGKATFEYAWVMDEGETERKKGVTINIAKRTVHTKSRAINFIDAPGHKDFVINMINGATQADVAVLVIDSVQKAFEAGYLYGGQTKEHARIAKCLGVKKIIVAINKMDLNSWENSPYDYVIEHLSAFFSEPSMGYKESDIYYVPISGLLGKNLVAPCEELKWYKGKSLMQTIESIEAPIRETSKPIRISLSDIFVSSVGGQIGNIIEGRIESGIVHDNEQIMLIPGKVCCNLKSIKVSGNLQKTAYAGDSVEMSINFPKSFEFNMLKPGMVLCSPKYPSYVVTTFRAEITTFELKYPLIRGKSICIHNHFQRTEGMVTKIEKCWKEGEEKRNPKCISSNTPAIVEIKLSEPSIIELYSNFRGMGRIIIRDNDETVASGTVIELLK